MPITSAWFYGSTDDLTALSLDMQASPTYTGFTVGIVTMMGKIPAANTANVLLVVVMRTDADRQLLEENVSKYPNVVQIR